MRWGWAEILRWGLGGLVLLGRLTARGRVRYSCVCGRPRVDTLFQIDFTKDRIPWEKIRDLFSSTDQECAEVIASSPRFEREFIEATAQLPADEDDICSVVADPILRKLLKPTDE